MRSSAILMTGLMVFATAVADADEAMETRSPVRIDAEKLAGHGLEGYEPFPDEIVLAGESKHSYFTSFTGKELVVEVYQAAPAKLRIDDPWPYDEFILLLSGRLVLTDAEGTVTEYETGESLVVPKGFRGTWEMQGDFRELVVIETEAYMSSEEGE